MHSNICRSESYNHLHQGFTIIADFVCFMRVKTSNLVWDNLVVFMALSCSKHSADQAEKYAQTISKNYQLHILCNLSFPLFLALFLHLTLFLFYAHNTDKCHCVEGATCINNHGIFSCICINGYNGNGTFCEGNSQQSLKL